MRTEDIVSIFLAVFIAFLVAALLSESIRVGISEYIKTFSTIFGSIIGVFGAYWIATKRKRDDDTEERKRIVHSFITDTCTLRNQIIYCFNILDNILQNELSNLLKQHKNPSAEQITQFTRDHINIENKQLVDEIISIHADTMRISSKSHIITRIDKIKDQIQKLDTESFNIINNHIERINNTKLIFEKNNENTNINITSALYSFINCRHIMKLTTLEGDFFRLCNNHRIDIKNIHDTHPIIKISGYESDYTLRIN